MPDIDIDFCVNGREKVIDYIKDQEEYTAECVKNFRAVPDIEINRSTCYMSRMISLGAQLEQKYVDRLHKYIANMITIGARVRKDRKETDGPKASVYDRVVEQSNEIIAEFEFLRFPSFFHSVIPSFRRSVAPLSRPPQR